MPRMDGPTAFMDLPFTLKLASFWLGLALSTILVRWVIKAGPVDRPRERGSHHNPTPTSGGMAVIAATALALGLTVLFMPSLFTGFSRPAATLFIFAALMGISGAVDDVLGLTAKVRLGFQIICALGLAMLYPVTDLDFGFGLDIRLWWPIGVAGTAWWLIIVMNTINFVDGANGVAPGAQSTALIILLILALCIPMPGFVLLAGSLILLLLAAAGANLGLLPFNLFGRVFQGDAGALFSAALIGGAVPILHNLGYGSIWFGGYILAPVLSDVILTILMRWRHGEKLFEAHKRHLYQQWLIRRNSSHIKVAAAMWGLCLISGGLGLFMEYLNISRGIDLRFAELVVLIATLSLLWLKLRRFIGADREPTPPPPDAA